jgi:hypothetical protein
VLMLVRMTVRMLMAMGVLMLVRMNYVPVDVLVDMTVYMLMTVFMGVFVRSFHVYLLLCEAPCGFFYCRTCFSNISSRPIRRQGHAKLQTDCGVILVHSQIVRISWQQNRH